MRASSAAGHELIKPKLSAPPAALPHILLAPKQAHKQQLPTPSISPPNGPLQFSVPSSAPTKPPSIVSGNSISQPDGATRDTSQEQPVALAPAAVNDSNFTLASLAPRPPVDDGELRQEGREVKRRGLPPAPPSQLMLSDAEDGKRTRIHKGPSSVAEWDLRVGRRQPRTKATGAPLTASDLRAQASGKLGTTEGSSDPTPTPDPEPLEELTSTEEEERVEKRPRAPDPLPAPAPSPRPNAQAPAPAPSAPQQPPQPAIRASEFLQPAAPPRVVLEEVRMAGSSEEEGPPVVASTAATAAAHYHKAATPHDIKRRGLPPPVPPQLMLPEGEETRRTRTATRLTIQSPATEFGAGALASVRSKHALPPGPTTTPVGTKATPKSPFPHAPDGTVLASPGKKRGRPRKARPSEGTFVGDPVPEADPADMDAAEEPPAVGPGAERAADSHMAAGFSDRLGALLMVAATQPRSRGRPPKRIVAAPRADPIDGRPSLLHDPLEGGNASGPEATGSEMADSGSVDDTEEGGDAGPSPLGVGPVAGPDRRGRHRKKPLSMTGGLQLTATTTTTLGSGGGEGGQFRRVRGRPRKGEKHAAMAPQSHQSGPPPHSSPMPMPMLAVLAAAGSAAGFGPLPVPMALLPHPLALPLPLDLAGAMPRGPGTAPHVGGLRVCVDSSACAATASEARMEMAVPGPADWTRDSDEHRTRDEGAGTLLSPGP